MAQLKSFLLLMIVMPALDFVWLGKVTPKFYYNELQTIVRSSDGQMEIRYFPAVLVYILLAAGITFFVLPKAGADDPWWFHALWGGLFGLIGYGVYDMTNLAILEKWTVPVSIADVAWGTVMCAISAVAARWVSLPNA